MLTAAQAWLNATLKVSEGIAATYSRVVDGVTQAVPLTVRVGRTVFSTRGGADEPGPAVLFGERDYLVEVADLDIPTVGLTTPDTGDRITEAISGLVFEVMTPETNEPAWRYSDQSRTLYRVHTKRVA